MKERRLASETTVEVPPSDPAARAQFASRAAAQRAEEAREEQADLGAAPPAADVAGDQVRTDLENAQDATAVVRCAFLFMLYGRVRRGRASHQEAHEKRSRVDTRALRVGGRLGPRLGGLLGGTLFWAGALCEFGTEALEELIDRELDAQAEAAEAARRASPTGEAAK